MRFKLLSLFAAVFCLFAANSSQLLAQQAPQNYMVNFYVLSWDETIRDLRYTSAGQERTLVVTNGAPSGPFRYNGPSPLTFFKQDTDEAGRPIKVPQAQAAISGNSQKPLLLLFLKSRQGVTPYNVLPLANAVDFDESGKSSGNSVFIMNISGQPLALALNDKKSSLASNSQELIRINPRANGSYSLQIAQQNEGAWKVTVSTMWFQSGNAQNLIFIIKDPDKPNAIKFRRFSVTPKG